MILMGTAYQAGLTAGREAKEKGYNNVPWRASINETHKDNNMVFDAMHAAYEWFYSQEPQNVGALLFLYRYFAEGYLTAFKDA